MRRLITLVLVLASIVACKAPQENKKYTIVCTTGMLADAVSALTDGIDSVEVISLMGPGTDPHLYKATQGDVFALSRGDLIVYNGLHLEGKMQNLFNKLPSNRVYAAAEVLADSLLINASEFEEAYDPHVWFDLSLWSTICGELSKRLQLARPESSEILAKNEKVYRQALSVAHQEAKKRLSKIPDKQRVLVTAHDAFKYFGAAYDMEVRGLQGISTTAEFGLRDISDLARFINERGIKAVFIESSISPKAIEAVQEAVQRSGNNLKLGGELYSDALGPEDSEAGDFIGMFYKNLKTIEEALK